MRVTLWGTRGSLPSAGTDTVRYGGNTSCVEVRGSNGDLLILDAGTGIRRLGASMPPGVQRTDILLTHLHMDHLLGIGFFRALYELQCNVHIWVPPETTLDLRDRMSRYLSPPLFPTPLRDLPCDLALHEVPRGSFRIGSCDITADLVCHPGLTVGYRIAEDDVSIAYMPDHEPALGAASFPDDPSWTSGYDLARNVDLLIHDAQYTTAEYEVRMGWGHSTILHALRFASFVGAAHLVTFHHDPAHTDAELDDLLAEALLEHDPPLEVSAGVEGASFVVGHDAP